MTGIVGYADQIALFAQHFEYTFTEVQRELPAAADEETHLVFGMAVFAVGNLVCAAAMNLPMLLAGLAAGIAVSIFQTVTSIQDNVLAFIPRAAAIFAVFALTFPWILRQVTGFSQQLIARLPEYIR